VEKKINKLKKQSLSTKCKKRRHTVGFLGLYKKNPYKKEGLY
jgi:hypothetical protein